MDSPSVISRRRTIRRYTDRSVPLQLINSVLEAGTRAPSPHNRQPWRFATITGNARIRLALAMGKQLRADLTKDGQPPHIIDADVARSYQRITSAPVSILLCLTMHDMDVYPDAHRNEMERWMAGQATAAAIQNILLRAAELSLGACWMCAPLFCPAVVVETLHLPSDWEPQALIALGYPADDGKERTRMALDSICLFISE
jgi:coenzyme F420-0:L-glutamate ligase / coenzyme F420-1:gamma-L-glutamate ligase